MPQKRPYKPVQGELPLLESKPLLGARERLSVLDLFAGIGGLSAGFQEAGFSVIGVDSEEIAGTVFRESGFGTAHTADLGESLFHADVSVIIGGPPCRPWSPVNLQRRRSNHSDHRLLTRFLEHVAVINPAVFVMENVPALKSDPLYSHGVRALRSAGYDIGAQVLQYDSFGAATRRRRLFTVGVRETTSGAEAFFQYLSEQHRVPGNVRDAIWRFRDVPKGAFVDHDWSELKSIGNYRARYESGQFGWRQLTYDGPAPSFGSVSKTYILHPEAGQNGYPERVLSVREVMAIMGFPDHVRFPDGTPRATRYQMVANAVSPHVSRAVAAALRRLLGLT